MKKIIRLFTVVVLVGLCLSLTSCFNKYKDVAGTYECYEIRVNGQNYLSYYDYYRITLEANGDCLVESKSGSEYSAECTFEIKDSKIYVYTRVGVAKVTETYDFINNEIIMDTEVQGSTIYAKFRKTK